jgi:pimeloyl-ACP methyl ester carboxylesterase
MKPIRPVNRRAAALVAAASVLLLLAVAGCSYTDRITPTSAPAAVRLRQPTVVLVHGADAESSSWHGVIARLQKRGHPVIAFANPLRGVASDTANLKDVLSTVKGPVVLVGHSYGGMVISGAAAGNRHVKSLVFVDAQIPLPGETAAQLTNKYPGSQYGASLLQRPFTLPNGKKGTDLYVRPAKYRALFTGTRISKAQALALAALQRPVAVSALNEPATKAAWRRIPSWDVIGTKDTAIPPASQLFMARRAHAHITRIPAPHASMLTFPGRIAKVIEAASR